MKRRTFIQGTIMASMSTYGLASLVKQPFEQAMSGLEKVVSDGLVESASIFVRHRGVAFARHYGLAKSDDAMFLLGSISKPICITALMTLFDRGEFRLDDRLSKFLPAFVGDGRENVTMKHLMTHTCGLPDQLSQNNELRRRHATLNEFVDHAIKTPLQFSPGTRYQYSSMGILLAMHVAERISGKEIRSFVQESVFDKLKMKHSAQGLGRFNQSDMVSCQTMFSAPESGGGDPTAKDWDWNSSFWRKLGAPWGGTHCSAPDIGLFLAEFLLQQGRVVKPETARLMTTNQNASQMTSRGLGFGVGASTGGRGCSELTFGHTGSTGTIAWADPKSESICVVLTSLPGTAVKPHPREVASDAVATEVTGQ